ncbi:MAG: glycosyl hydrolase family 28-related protein [Thermosynechococcaceae cyanobacterium]
MKIQLLFLLPLLLSCSQAKTQSLARSSSAAPTTIADNTLSDSSNIVFPKDAGVLDVMLYGAVPDDGQDDTAAIQKALDQQANGNRIVYLPNGTYLISDRLNWPGGDRPGNEHKRTILQGQSRQRTVIQLKDSTAGYQDPKAPKALIWTGKAPAQRFRNAIRDLTINTGNNNPGAIGIQFIANNQGEIRSVTILSNDQQGVIGLDMSYTDEIGPLLVSHLQVSGFDYGIKSSWQTASITFEDIVLEKQNVLGWENFGQTIFVKGLRSQNAVPVLSNLKNSPGSVVLVDAELVGIDRASNYPAIQNQKQMFLRNVKISGYATSVEHQDKGRGNEPGVSTQQISEWLSHGKKPLSLFNSPSKSLNLPAKDTPQIPWDAIDEWISPLQFGGVPNDSPDDTAAIQAAIDSGATTIYLPNGQWMMSGSLTLRKNVRRLIGTEAALISENGATIHFSNGTSPTVHLERLDTRGKINLSHDSSRTLVLSSMTLHGRYTNTGSGDVFIEDVVGGPFYFRNQNVWARQFNQETDVEKTNDEAKIVNDGGNLWILGLKTERPGTVIKTINQGKTEVLGGYIFSTGGPKVMPAFVSEDSSLSLAGVVERNFNRNPFQGWVEATQGGQNLTLTTSQRDETPLFADY